ncbi:DNA cytosine methyltransferase [Algoriphagus sp.]|uniref:DNA cytosine methyltransferase n=1 Tax=Algoriphagus sp. TaxID=1872435 RepID=UPI00391C2B3D
MLTTSQEKALDTVEEPQLDLLYQPIVLDTDSRTKDEESIRVLSLFSGCGGMDLGFEGGFEVLKDSVNELLHPDFISRTVDSDFVQLRKTKFKTVFANDILTDARNAWVNFFIKRGHRPEFFFKESIVDLVKLHRSGTPVFPQNIDLVTGGFPCQDFSIAGKRNGFNSHKNHLGEIIEDDKATVETRGQLYMWMKEVIEITQPKIFVAENVKGLANLPNVKEIIQKDFSNAGGNGYIVLDPMVLHSADYGVPQSRERVIFIGIKKSALTQVAFRSLTAKRIPDSFNPYPSPTHSYLAKGEQLKPFVKLSRVFETLEEPKNSKELSQQFYSKAKYMGAHCQGQTEIKLNSIGPTIRAEHHGNIEFRRLSKAHGGKIDHELEAGLPERRLTVRECALIQTFPKDYDFVIPKKEGRKGSFLVSPSQAYKIIGNAVPPLLAFNLAARLEALWDTYFD